jgi:type IV secretory pathway VirD2 relaxase
MTKGASHELWAHERNSSKNWRQSAVEVVVADRSEADSKIKGGAVGRLVGGWSRSRPRTPTVPWSQRSACNWLKPAISLGSSGTALSPESLMRRGPDLGREDGRLRPKLGRARGERRPRLFIGRVLAAKERAGFGSGVTAGRPAAPAKHAVGRGGVAAWRAGGALLNERGRRVVVKARIVRHGLRMGPLGAHLGYLRREGVTKDGEPARMFDADSENADVGAFVRRTAGDRHHFRFIVSPEDAAELTDLHAYTRDLVRQMEEDLGTRLDWIAVDHWNTDNPHVHLILRGKEDGGRDLVIHREYISQGLRARAQELATIELGPRSEQEIRTRLTEEVRAERWTQLDRTLQRAASTAADGVIDLRPAANGAEGDRQLRGLLIGRLQQLEAMGLAQARGRARWRLAADAELTLREIGMRGDIVRTLNRALARGVASITIHEQGGPTQPAVGRVAAKGLDDELAGRPYLIVDGVDGETHYVRLGIATDLADIPQDGIVRTAASRSGRWANLRILSDLSLADQVRAMGATWLDRELVSREKTPLALAGFGAETREALEQRADRLVQEGLARRRGQQLVFASDLLGTLERRGVADAARAIAAETGLSHRIVEDGQRFNGLYQRRMTLASGRFALIVNETNAEFALVPWRPGVDRAVGKTVLATLRGRTVQWSLGSERGMEIG